MKQLTGELVAAYEKKIPPNPDVTMPATFPGRVQNPLYGLPRQGYSALWASPGTTKLFRPAHMVKMTGGFGAPVIIYVIFHSDLAEPYSMFDLGAITHANPVRRPTGKGSGTCIEAQLALYPTLIPARLNLPVSHKIAVGLALGYPDPTAPANAFRTDREPLEKFVRWIS